MAKNRNPMTPEAARRIQSAADRNPNSKTRKTGFKQRAQRAASKNYSKHNKNRK